MMPSLWPGIREKNIGVLQSYFWRQRSDDLRGFSADEGEIRKMCSVSLSLSPLDSVGYQVDSEMEAVWSGGRKRGEKVPMAATDL